MVLYRTPYSSGPYGPGRYPKSLATKEMEAEGFIFVWQDVRGRYRSDGEFVNTRPHAPDKSGKATDESSDTYDTIEWLLGHVPFHNGKVGQWGLSYPGFYASMGAIDSHPALVAVSPQAPIADWFWDDMHRHGAFNLTLTFLFFARFGVPRTGLTTESAAEFDPKTPDGYQFFLDMGPLRNADERYLKGGVPYWKELTAHPNYDAFWKARTVLPHLRKVKSAKSAMLVVGGWFDTEDLFGTLRTYEAIERQNPGTSNRLVVGPWAHGDWVRDEGRKLGTADFGSPTSGTSSCPSSRSA
jgi:putative CocE/NonD family hydrolase